MAETETGRCGNCRAPVPVEPGDEHGHQLSCRNCNTLLRVIRKGGELRLVIADPGPLRDELSTLQQRIQSSQAELSGARASFGIGANGFGIGMIYVLVKLVYEEAPFTRELVWEAVGIAVAVGVLLELANFLFLAKRQAISRLSTELAELQKEARVLQQKLRDAARG